MSSATGVGTVLEQKMEAKRLKIGVEEAKNVQKYALSTEKSLFSENVEQSIVAQLPLWVNYTKFE